MTIQFFLDISRLISFMGNVSVALLGWIFIGLIASNAVLAQNSVTGMRMGEVTVDDMEGLRIVVETGSPIKAKLSLLREPYRLVIDMPDTSWQVSGLPQRGPLSIRSAMAYRFGNPKPQLGRLVIELSQPTAPLRAFALPPASGGHRFVIDLVDVGDTAFMVASSALKKNPTFDFKEIPKNAQTTNSSTKAVKVQMKLPKSKI